MEYLDRIKQLTGELSKIDVNWKGTIYTDKDDQGKFEDAKRKLEEAYFEAIKYAENNSMDMDDLESKVSKLLGNKTFLLLRDKLKTMVATFENARIINHISDRAAFIMDCFERAIVRRDNSFISEWEKYGFASMEEMVKAIGAINRIAVSHVKLSYSKKSASDDFKRITDLDEELCCVYSEKFDGSYERLQMKMILRAFNDVNDQFDALIDALTDID